MTLGGSSVVARLELVRTAQHRVNFGLFLPLQHWYREVFMDDFRSTPVLPNEVDSSITERTKVGIVRVSTTSCTNNANTPRSWPITFTTTHEVVSVKLNHFFNIFYLNTLVLTPGFHVAQVDINSYPRHAIIAFNLKVNVT